MEVSGRVEFISEIKEVGASGFKTQSIVVETKEQYPQLIEIQFVQDKTVLLGNISINQEVKVSINLRGRKWVSPTGEVKYFNTLQGWNIV